MCAAVSLISRFCSTQHKVLLTWWTIFPILDLSGQLFKKAHLLRALPFLHPNYRGAKCFQNWLMKVVKFELTSPENLSCCPFFTASSLYCFNSTRHSQLHRRWTSSWSFPVGTNQLHKFAGNMLMQLCYKVVFFKKKKKVSCRSPHGEPQPSWTLTMVQEKTWQAGIKFSNAGCLNSLSHASIYPDSLLPLKYLWVLLQVTLKQHGVYLTSSHCSATNTMSQRKDSNALSGFSTILGTQNQVLEKAKTALTLRILWRASTTAFKDSSDSCSRQVCCNRKRNLSEFLQHRNIQVQHYINESQY